MILRRITAWTLCLGLVSLALVSCSDSTSPDAKPAILKGTITEQNGDPVEGAAILISFAPSFEDVLQPRAGLSLDKDLPPPVLQSAIIQDPCGNVVRTLCDGDCDEMLMISWDGLDDRGNRAVEGLYFFEAAFEDTTFRQELILIHFYADWDPEDGNAHARTDAQGQFQLEDKCLGFGTQITVTDEEGNIIDTRPLQRVINLQIMAPDGRFAQRDSLWWPAESSLTVNYRFTASPPAP